MGVGVGGDLYFTLVLVDLAIIYCSERSIQLPSAHSPGAALYVVQAIYAPWPALLRAPRLAFPIAHVQEWQSRH